MKISFLSTTFPLHTGHHASPFIRELAVALAGLGEDIAVTAPGAAGAQTDEMDNGVHVHRFSYHPIPSRQCVVYRGGAISTLKSSWPARFQLPLYMAAFYLNARRNTRGCDVIHGHWSVAGLIGLLCREHGTPLVVSILGSDFTGAGGRVVDLITRWVTRRADAVITVSSELRRRLSDAGVSDDRLYVIHNGVDLERFQPASNRDVLRNTPVIDKSTIFLFVGRLVNVKGPDIALQAFEQLCSNHYSLGLVFAGDGNMREALEDRVQGTPSLRGSVHFAGNIPMKDIHRFYQAADVVVISSRAEGTPNSLFEALACGLPVAATPVGGIPDIIRHEETGLLAVDGTAGQLAGTMKLLIDRPELRTAIGRNARKWSESELSWQRTAEQVRTVYAGAIERRKQDIG